jgi:hypothetical protein
MIELPWTWEMRNEPVTSRLVLDCMGNGFHFVNNTSHMYAVHGSCAAGWQGESNLIGEQSSTLIPKGDKKENGMMQYLEAFGWALVGMGAGTSDVKIPPTCSHLDADE